MKVHVQLIAEDIIDRIVFPFQLLFMGLAFLLFGRVAITMIKSKFLEIEIVQDEKPQ